LVYVIEKDRLPLAAYEDLTQALADPEPVFTEAVVLRQPLFNPCGRCHALKCRTCQTGS
jgi:hypothetical protein